MNIRRFLTRALGLLTRPHRCTDGPMAGESVILTENSKSTAWLVVRGEIGRYVDDGKGGLTWERML